MILDNNRVMIQQCFVVWDGITRPEQIDPKTPGGAPGMKWNVKVVIAPNNPAIAELDQLAQACLAGSEFKGVLPNGGTMPIGMTNPSDAWAQFFPGFHVVNASTYRTPTVYDENGVQLDPMQYGAQMYNGQMLDIIVHCKDFNNRSKGVAARLDGLKIIASANAPRIEIGGGGFDCAGAFGGAAGQQAMGQPQQAANFLPGQQ